jgi:NADPH:quinone reductase-like Zn-dependent oxidoreductase
VNLAGLTAWRATVTCAEAGPGRTILVTGAGSGVATFAVQIAVALGATVFATTSTRAKAGRLEELGASQVFLYTEPDWQEQVQRASGGGVDAVIDSYGADGWARGLKALRVGGALVSFGDTGGVDATVEVADVYWKWRSIVGTSMGSPEEYRALLDHVETAAWRPVIDSVFELDRIAGAARRLDGDPDRFGKVVLVP